MSLELRGDVRAVTLSSGGGSGVCFGWRREGISHYTAWHTDCFHVHIVSQPIQSKFLEFLFE